jgi:putative DNA primase/helicase
MIIDIRTAACLLGGEVVGRNSVSCPGLGHAPKDRSLSVLFDQQAPGGFVVHSFAGDDDLAAKDYVRSVLGWRSEDEPLPLAKARQRPQAPPDEDNIAKARWLWNRRGPVEEGSPVWTYLRTARGYHGRIPRTLGYLPSRGAHAPALIAPFGIPVEVEPGELAIDDAAVRGIHLIRLKRDGLGKIDVKPKISLGRGSLGSPIVAAPVNDSLTLAICEGLEDALSVHEAYGCGAWAAGGESRLPQLAESVPGYVARVVVYSDFNQSARDFARQLAARLKRRAFRVILKTWGAQP